MASKAHDIVYRSRTDRENSLRTGIDRKQRLNDLRFVRSELAVLVFAQ